MHKAFTTYCVCCISCTVACYGDDKNLEHLAFEYFVTFYFSRGGVVSAWPNPPKLEDHPLSAARNCLFNLFAATLHIGGRSSIRNLRTLHAVVAGTHKHGRL